MAWQLIALLIVSLVLSVVFRPKPNVQKLKPQKIKSPVVREGREIPVIFGTIWIVDPNMVWFGDTKVEAVKKKV